MNKKSLFFYHTFITKSRISSTIAFQMTVKLRSHGTIQQEKVHQQKRFRHRICPLWKWFTFAMCLSFLNSKRYLFFIICMSTICPICKFWNESNPSYLLLFSLSTSTIHFQTVAAMIETISRVHMWYRYMNIKYYYANQNHKY